MCDGGFEMLCYFILGSHSRIYSHINRRAEG